MVKLGNRELKAGDLIRCDDNEFRLLVICRGTTEGEILYEHYNIQRSGEFKWDEKEYGEYESHWTYGLPDLVGYTFVRNSIVEEIVVGGEIYV